MKQKYLLGMLLGGALLTACSVEDDLNPADVAQDVNPSAPVFTVVGDPLTRADFVEKVDGQNYWQLKFTEKDVLSLFHGTSVANADLKNWENAIYGGTASGNSEGITFSTTSMVNPGYAVMVFPADTTFSTDKSKAPVLRVAKYQNKKTKELTPYMSEILNIETWSSMENDPKSQTAGYGRNYQIALKRVGSTLTLNLDKINEDKIIPNTVPDNVVDTVALVDETSGSQAFTIEASIVVENANDATKHPFKYTDPYQIWAKVSELDITTSSTTLKGTDRISTTDVVNSKVATFTLLPTGYKGLNIEADHKIADGMGKVVIYTTYGTVTLADSYTKAGATTETNEKIWYKRSADGTRDNKKDSTITHGLNNLLKDSTLWCAPSTASKLFGSENQGGHITRYVEVDMTKLDMNGLHIKGEEHLMNVLKVYNFAKNNLVTKKVNLILDGGQKDPISGVTNPAGQFVMSKNTWEAAAKWLKDNKTDGVSFELCSKSSEVCNVVKLDNKENGEEEVPELQFVNKLAEVQLAGKNWKYEGTDSTSTTAKNLDGVEQLTVLENANVKLIGTIYASHSKDHKFQIAIKNKGEAIVSKNVVLQDTIVNNGTISINAQTDRLAVDMSGLVENMQGESGWDTGNAYTGGRIKNGGTLAVIDGKGGVINNYGIITLTSENARTLITKNADDGADLSDPFSANNRFGTIELYEITGGKNNTQVLEGMTETTPGSGIYTYNEKAGFIKIKYTQVTNNNYGTVANYVVLDGTVDTYERKDKVVYVEIQSKNEVVLNTSTIDGLIVNEEKAVNIPRGQSVTVSKHVYVPKGTIIRAGNFTYNVSNLSGYFGGSTSDVNNIFSFQ